MIDLVTGNIELNGVIINPNVLLVDFEKYGEEIVHINNRGNGRGIVRFKQMIKSNGIDAAIKVSIDEEINFRSVTITPTLQNTSGLTVLDASKQWLRGMAIGEYVENENVIRGKYRWGYMCAQYRDDRDYGVVGGDIRIRYGVC